MELKNDAASYATVAGCVIDHYKASGQTCVEDGDVLVETKQGPFGATVGTQKFFVEPALWLWVHIPTGGRDEILSINFAIKTEKNSFGLWDELVKIDRQELYAWELTTENLQINLKLIDDLIAGRIKRVESQ